MRTEIIDEIYQLLLNNAPSEAPPISNGALAAWNAARCAPPEAFEEPDPRSSQGADGAAKGSSHS